VRQHLAATTFGIIAPNVNRSSPDIAEAAMLKIKSYGITDDAERPLRLS
jgi:hypothetical protein